MLVDTLNIGHYRVIDYNGRKYSLFNRQNDVIMDITQKSFKRIKDENSIAACKFVEDAKGKIE
jgi:hypothetical protein